MSRPEKASTSPPIPPAGTFLARARNGAIELPPPFRRYCEANGWNLFQVERVNEDRLTLTPILAGDTGEIADGCCSSLSHDGHLWIPVRLRTMAGLGEQSVMVRIEAGVIAIYLRKVFDTLGFRP